MEKPATKNVQVVNRFERGWPVKRATPLFSSFCSDVAKQVARFLLPVFPYLSNWQSSITPFGHFVKNKRLFYGEVSLLGNQFVFFNQKTTVLGRKEIPSPETFCMNQNKIDFKWPIFGRKIVQNHSSRSFKNSKQTSNCTAMIPPKVANSSSPGFTPTRSRQNLRTGVAELCSPPARLSTSQISGFATRRPDSHHRGGTLKWLFMCILTVLSILRLIPIQVPIIWLPAGHCETGNPVVFRMPPARNSRSQIEKKINAFFFNCYSPFSVNI